MEIKVAASAGFCFGVKRAVELVEKLVSEGKKVCTLGAIIHNPQKVQELAEKGVRIVSAIEEVMPKETLVIRSHGVGASVIDSIEQAGIAYENATCPFVHTFCNIFKDFFHSILLKVVCTTTQTGSFFFERTFSMISVSSSSFMKV